MPNARDVARYFISKSEESTSKAVTPLKLQKLVYYAQGWYLARHRNLLFEESLLAWDHGPVVRVLYDDYRRHGYYTIPSKPFVNQDEYGDTIFDTDELEVLNDVWEAYGDFDGKYLEEMTHQEDPWLFTARNSIIDIDLIREYFIENLYVVN